MMASMLSNDLSLIEYLIGTVIALCGFYLCRIVYGFWCNYYRMSKMVQNIPGPSVITLLGNAWEFAKNAKECLNIMTRIGAEYPICHFWLGPKLIIAMTEPEDLEVALTSTKITQKAFFYKFMEPAFEGSLICSHGPRMRAIRKILVPLINGKQLPYYVEIFNQQIRHHIETLKKNLDGDEFDIHDSTKCCMADMIYGSVLGWPTTIQDTGDLLIPEAVETGLEIFFKRCISPWLYPNFIFNLTQSGKIYETVENTSKEFYTEILNEKKQVYRALARGDKNVKRPGPSILDQLIENIGDTDIMTDKEIRANLNGLFIGSYDTILGIFSFTILMLAMHQDIQEKVREEAIAVIGSNADVTEENCKNLTYTEMVIKEVLRLFPIGPLLPREVTEDIEINNYTLPKGSTLLMMPIVTHKCEKYWDEPNKFIPERFSAENSKNRHAYAYVPFSAGPRTCPGGKFGMACMKTMVIQYIRSYHFSTSMNLKTLKLRSDISVRSQNGYMVSITEPKRL